MATAPPPYSPRQQRDAAKAARRAQRYYWRSARKPSITGPTVLIAIGVIALLVETGKLSMVRLWDWYAQWWPLLLIVVGLLSLGEWYLDRDKPYGTRRAHGGLVTLIVLLAILGYANHGLRGFDLFHGGNEGLMHFFGQEHDDDQSLNQAIPAHASVDIQVPHGDVTITPSADQEIHVQTHQVVYAANDRDAERAFRALTPTISVSGNTASLRVAYESNGHADLTIELPADASPTVTSGHGDVTMQGLDTPVNVTSEKGDVHLEGLRSSAHARMSKGDFTAHDVTGDVSLEGRLDDVTISDVKGRVVLDGDFFGDTHLAQVASPVHFHSSRTDIELASLPGDVSLDSGDLHVENAAGPARITTRAKDVQVMQVSGDLRIEDSDGEVTAGSAAPLGPVWIHSRNGAINLNVPPDAGYQVEANARNGSVESDLGLTQSGAGEGHTASGKIGAGGPRVELTADHGDIRINKADTAVPPVAPAPPPAVGDSGPPAPSAPRPPGMHAPPHLKAPRGTEQPSVQ